MISLAKLMQSCSRVRVRLRVRVRVRV